MKKLFSLFLIAGILFITILPIYAEDEIEMSGETGDSGVTGEKIIADLIFLRPFGIASCVVGGAAAIVSLPFLAFKPDAAKVVVRELFTKPGQFTFERPLGAIDFHNAE
jgi:hypothetical protein